MKYVWGATTGREWDDVAREAREGGYDVHFRSLIGILVEKKAELPKGDPKRKYKGRVVFLGDRVRDQDNSETHRRPRRHPARLLWLFPRPHH